MEGKDRSWERRKEKRGRPPAKNSLGTFVSEKNVVWICVRKKKDGLSGAADAMILQQSTTDHNNQNTIQDKYGSSQVFLVYITAVQASAGLWTLAYIAMGPKLGQDFRLEPTNLHWWIGSGQVLVTQALFSLFR